MKFNKLTYNISFAIVIIAALYTLIYSGLTGLLLCSAVGLIIAAFLDQFEIIVALSVLFALFYIYFLKNMLKRFEPFDPTPTIPEKKPTNQLPIMKEVSGFLSSFSEGFASPEGDTPEKKLPGEPSTSSHAPSDIKEAVPTDEVNKVTEAAEKVNKDKKTTDIPTEEFQSATNGLFKLGKMPSEHAEGPMLDAGSTLLKAMSSFKPEQINAMSSDTKQLLETQKSLMGMLNQMRPVLADGKELLHTFSGMFGNGGLNMAGLNL
jgi:hypothetical protein